MSIVLVCRRKPPSVNNISGKGRDSFGAELEACYDAAGRPKLDGLLYGIVCWFVRGYNPDTDPDADNISKNIWDLLSERTNGGADKHRRLGAFKDDKQIRLRIASIFDLGSRGEVAQRSEELDLTGLPSELIEWLDVAIERAGEAVSKGDPLRNLTYIRFGSLKTSMYRLSPSGGDL